MQHDLHVELVGLDAARDFGPGIHERLCDLTRQEISDRRRERNGLPTRDVEEARRGRSRATNQRQCPRVGVWSHREWEHGGLEFAVAWLDADWAIRKSGQKAVIRLRAYTLGWLRTSKD
jgi:hypothetical protein